MKILLVEDDLVDQMAFSRWISKELVPCQLTTANGVNEVAQLAPHQQFEVIVCDFNLPDGTVLDVAELLPPLQIICISGNRDPQKVEQVKAAGISHFLLKDNHLDYLNQLKQIITGWYDKTSPTPAATVTISHNKGEEIINLDNLRRAFDHKPAPIRDIIQLFLTQTPPQLEELEKAIHNNDRLKSKDIAHRLKSSYKMMGLYDQVEYLQTIEDECQLEQTQPSKFVNILQHILNDSNLAYQQLQQALENI